MEAEKPPIDALWALAAKGEYGAAAGDYIGAEDRAAAEGADPAAL